MLLSQHIDSPENKPGMKWEFSEANMKKVLTTHVDVCASRLALLSVIMSDFVSVLAWTLRASDMVASQ